jgi:AcrR family transcriptional regulator
LAPRPDVSEERKKQILEAAISVFAKLGFHKARMDDISEASGLSKGALYWYFDSKDDIITNIMEYVFGSSFKELNSLPTPDGNIRKHLVAMLSNSMEDAIKMLEIRPIIFEFFAHAFQDGIIQQTLRDYFRYYTQQMIPLIQQGIDTGEFRQIDAYPAALALGSIFEGIILLWMYDPHSVDIDLHFRIALNLLLDGFEKHT